MKTDKELLIIGIEARMNQIMNDYDSLVALKPSVYETAANTLIEYKTEYDKLHSKLEKLENEDLTKE